MKKLIDDFIKQNENIHDFLNISSHDIDDPDKVIKLFSEFLRQNKFNAALGIDFANNLQLSNDKNIFNQYELSDISRLFTSLIRLQDFNLDTYLESAHFEWSVMDNVDKAKAIINDGLDKARRRTNDLTKLLEDINKG